MSGVVVQNMSLKKGQTLTVSGVPNADSTNFTINVGNSAEELALHINPRFDAHGDQRVVVCNSFQGGNWCEEQRNGGFPFNQGEEFKGAVVVTAEGRRFKSQTGKDTTKVLMSKIKITFTGDEFEILLPDSSEIRFPNRVGAEKFKYLHFDGEVRIHGIEIK